MLLVPEFATAISIILSLSKSSMAIECGRERLPVEYVAPVAKVPLPTPRKISTLLAP
jgi:hypothetical protein